MHPETHRSPECPAGVEAPRDLVNAVRSLSHVAGHGQEVQEVRHLDRVAAVLEGDGPGGSAAHACVAARVGGRVSAIRAPAPRFDEVDGRVVAVELRRPLARRCHEAIDELGLSVDDLAQAERLPHAITAEHGTLDQGFGLVALDLLEIVLEVLELQREAGGVAGPLLGCEQLVDGQARQCGDIHRARGRNRSQPREFGQLAHGREILRDAPAVAVLIRRIQVGDDVSVAQVLRKLGVLVERGGQREGFPRFSGPSASRRGSDSSRPDPGSSRPRTRPPRLRQGLETWRCRAR